MSLQDISTFWWFVPGRLGAMGRPGFNKSHWIKYTLSECAIYSWIGSRTLTQGRITDFQSHSKDYLHKLAHALKIFDKEVTQQIELLYNPASLTTLVTHFQEKSGLYQEFHLDFAKDEISFNRNFNLAHHEIQTIQSAG